MNILKKTLIILSLCCIAMAEVFIIVPGTLNTHSDFVFHVFYGTVHGWANAKCNTWPIQNTIWVATHGSASCPFAITMEAHGYALDPSTVGSEGIIRAELFPPGGGPLLAESFNHFGCNGNSSGPNFVHSGPCTPMEDTW